jgi:hypothetical protein
VHRLAWALLGLAVAACGAGYLVAGPVPRNVLFTGAFVLLAGGLWIGWVNGRRIERRWRSHGVRGELEVTSVSPETKDRLSVVGTVHLPDRPARTARFKAYVQTFEHRYVAEGSRLSCTVLDEDPGRMRVHLRKELPDKSAMFVEDQDSRVNGCTAANAALSMPAGVCTW